MRISVERISVFATGLFLLVGLNIYFTSMGGLGNVQSLNTLTQVTLPILFSILFLALSLSRSLAFSNAFLGCLFLGGSVFVSSLLNDSSFLSIVPTLLGIAVLTFGVYIANNLSLRSAYSLIWLVFSAATVQAIIGLLQYYFITEHVNLFFYNPDYGRPYGIFGQVNTFASFVATGAVLGMVYLTRVRSSTPVTLLALVMLAIDIYTLNLAASRTGLLSFAISVVLIALYYLVAFKSYRKTVTSAIKKHVPYVLFFIVTLVTIAGGLKYFSQKDSGVQNTAERVVKGDTSQRVYMYTLTGLMVLDKPILGYGYGNYYPAQIEKGAEYYANGKLSQPGSVGLTHPHNILLYFWVQGGLLPILAILFSVSIFVRDTYRVGREGFLYLAMMVPIALHLNLEHPFTASIPHIFVFGLLLGLLPTSRRFLLSSRLLSFNMATMMLFAVVSLGYFLPLGVQHYVRYSNIAMYSALDESQRDKAVVHLFLDGYQYELKDKVSKSRYQGVFDAAMKNKDAKLFQSFIVWASEFVKHSPSDKIYRNLVMARLITNDRLGARQDFERMRYLFPQSRAWLPLEKYFP